MNHLSNPPILQSSQLILRPLKETDWQLVQALYSNRQVTSGFGVEPLTIEECRHKFSQLLGPWAQNGFSQFVIIDNSNQREAGLGGIRPTHKNDQGEIGYVLLPQAWGRGIASEAVRLWTDWGLNQLRLNRIIADGVENPASIKVLQKSGYLDYGHKQIGPRQLVSLAISPRSN